jgi:hypothetical protein
VGGQTPAGLPFLSAQAAANLAKKESEYAMLYPYRMLARTDQTLVLSLPVTSCTAASSIVRDKFRLGEEVLHRFIPSPIANNIKVRVRIYCGSTEASMERLEKCRRLAMWHKLGFVVESVNRLDGNCGEVHELVARIQALARGFAVRRFYSLIKAFHELEAKHREQLVGKSIFMFQQTFGKLIEEQMSIIVAAEAVLRVEIVRDELQEWEVEVSVLESQLPDVWYQGRKKYQYKVGIVFQEHFDRQLIERAYIMFCMVHLATKMIAHEEIKERKKVLLLESTDFVQVKKGVLDLKRKVIWMQRKPTQEMSEM